MAFDGWGNAQTEYRFREIVYFFCWMLFNYFKPTLILLRESRRSCIFWMASSSCCISLRNWVALFTSSALLLFNSSLISAIDRLLVSSSFRVRSTVAWQVPPVCRHDASVLNFFIIGSHFVQKVAEPLIWKLIFLYPMLWNLRVLPVFVGMNYLSWTYTWGQFPISSMLCWKIYIRIFHIFLSFIRLW